MENIKLVIWDLDETFWKGTLSEEGVEMITENIAIIKELSERGIMNSVASKNNYSDASKKLEEMGVWEYFIFPAIEWSPKGDLIKRIISNCQLREENVLFIDDNHLNLREAKFYSPKIFTAEPSFIKDILLHHAFKGKPDGGLTRLKQYRILEQKNTESKKFASNLDFLNHSQIKIELIYDIEANKKRLHELLNRTNQLNFTKLRLSEDEIDALVLRQDLELALVRVTDRFGDYGIVGFYAIEKKTENLLYHFVFSCRIINLGVPQYIYAMLGFPKLSIVPEVAERLDHSKPDWIELAETSQAIQQKENNSDNIKILFKGGCDLSQMLFYLKDKKFSIQEETNYVSANGNPIHQEHTNVLIDGLVLSPDKKKWVEDHIPFADKDFYKSSIFTDKYDSLIYSVLMDYSQDRYLHKKLNVMLPFGGYDYDLTNESDQERIIGFMKKRRIHGFSDVFLKWFSEEFINIGKISPEDFLKNLMIIREKVPSNIPIIFVNGVEQESPDISENGALDRHILMNEALDRFIEEANNVFLLDLRQLVKDQSQLTDNIRHYRRETYKLMALELMKIIKKTSDGTIKVKIRLATRIKDNWAFRTYQKLYTGLLKKLQK